MALAQLVHIPSFSPPTLQGRVAHLVERSLSMVRTPSSVPGYARGTGFDSQLVHFASCFVLYLAY